MVDLHALEGMFYAGVRIIEAPAEADLITLTVVLHHLLILAKDLIVLLLLANCDLIFICEGVVEVLLLIAFSKLGEHFYFHPLKWLR